MLNFGGSKDYNGDGKKIRGVNKFRGWGNIQ